jgi:hypothetical protein
MRGKAVQFPDFSDAGTKCGSGSNQRNCWGLRLPSKLNDRGIVRYRTAAISCFVLIGAMFSYPAIVWAIFLPALKLGLPDPIPAYERILLDIAVLCMEWRFILVLPIIGLGFLFTIAQATLSRVRGRT